MQFVSFLRQHIKKRKWSERDDSLHRKTLCFQSKKIRSVVCWFISICVIRLRAVTVNGWTSRGTNRWHGPSVGGEAVSLSINDIICPADVFLCSLLSLWWHLTWKKRGRKGGKEIFPIRAVWTDAGVGDAGDSSSVCGDGNFKMFWPLYPNYWQQTHRTERDEDRLQ